MSLSLGKWFEADQRKLNILIVDDEATFRELVCRFTSICGVGEARFDEAADGETALKKFNPKKTDLVIIDQHMPGLKGIDVAMRMRAASAGRHIPIVFLTGDRRFGTLDDAMDRALADGFLHKPFSLSEFKSCLERALGTGGTVAKGAD